MTDSHVGDREWIARNMHNQAQNQLLGDMDELERENHNFKARLAGDRERSADLYQENEKLKARLKEIEAEVAGLRMENSRLRADFEVGSNDLSEARRHIARLVIDRVEEAKEPARPEMNMDVVSKSIGAIWREIMSLQSRVESMAQVEADSIPPYNSPRCDAIWNRIRDLVARVESLEGSRE